MKPEDYVSPPKQRIPPEVMARLRRSTVDALAKAYNADQPRVPAGSPEGGQFGSGGGGEGISEDTHLNSSGLPVPASLGDPLCGLAAGHLPDGARSEWTSWDDIVARAPEADKDFREKVDIGQGLEKALGADVVFVTKENMQKWVLETSATRPTVVVALLKTETSKDRIYQKVEKYKGDWGRLTDIVRGSVVVPTTEDIPSVLAAVKTMGFELAEKPTNRVLEPYDGYEDVALKIKLKGGGVGELLIITRAMVINKNMTEHAHFETQRNLLAKGPANLTAAERDQLARVEHEMRILNTTAARASRKHGGHERQHD